MSTTFSCIIDTTDGSIPLDLEIWFDNDLIFSNDHIQQTINFKYDFDDAEGDHEFRFVMKNKTNLHTKIDADGNIVSDACITVDSVAFDEIALGHIFVENTEYRHNFNGTQAEIAEPFYGTMGCNGSVSFRFTSPFYLWLLEHM